MPHQIRAHPIAGMLLAMSLVAWAPQPDFAQAASPAHSGKDTDVFTGVVEEIDAGRQKLVVKTDVGKAVDIEVTKPELLKDIGQGERITVEVDEKQQAVKIMKTIPIPEIPQPGTMKP
jgi:hypothetical protein